MNDIILKNAIIFDEDFNKKRADIKIEKGKIKEIGDFQCCDGIDMTGCTITPGFIDIHIHGCNGGDFCDGISGMKKMSEHLVTKGVTSFCGTTMTLGNEALSSILADAKSFKGKENGAKLVGINMEGPFVNVAKKGAQNEKYIRPGTVQEFVQLNEISGNIIKLLDIAPESFESDEFIKELSKITTVSIGHSNATAQQCVHAFEMGISHVTHLFNAMSAFNHRAPGIIGAAFDSDTARCELICDGNHIDKMVLRIAFKILGEDRCIVISDSMKASGAAEGIYDLGGQDVYVKDGYARLKDGTIAASISNIHEEFLNLLRFGIDEKAALKACTINPAKAIGEDDSIGSIKIGKDADLIVFDHEYRIKNVILKGALVNG